MPRHTRHAVLAGAATLAAGLAGCAEVGRTDRARTTETTERTLRTVPGTVTVTNELGDVTVTAGDREDASVTLTRRGPPAELDRLRFAVDRTDGRLVLRGSVAGDEPVRNDLGLSLDVEVTLPETAAVDAVETAAGDVSVVGVAGDPTVTATAGDVVVRNVPGPVSVETTAGDVTVRDVGAVDRVETDSGRVTVEVASVPDSAEITATAGDVEVKLAPDLDAAVTGETDTGDVSAPGLPLTVEEGVVGDRARGTLGDGGNRLAVETSAGSVTLRPLDG